MEPGTRVGAGDVQHWNPHFLPDGRHFLYFVVGSKAQGITDARAVYVGSLDPSEPHKLVLEGGTNAKYANDHLVYLRKGTLVAQPFDRERLEVHGDAVQLVEHVQVAGASAGTTGVTGAITVFETGVLAYQAGLGTRTQLAWYDRSGKPMKRLGEPGDVADVSLSPDDTRAAVRVLDPALGSRDVWTYDIARGLPERLTFDPGDDFAPIWSRPHGERIVYSSRRQGAINLYETASRPGGSDAYMTMESGRPQVYVRPFSGSGGTVARLTSGRRVAALAARPERALLPRDRRQDQGCTGSGEPRPVQQTQPMTRLEPIRTMSPRTASGSS